MNLLKLFELNILYITALLSFTVPFHTNELQKTIFIKTVFTNGLFKNTIFLCVFHSVDKHLIMSSPWFGNDVVGLRQVSNWYSVS